MKTYNRETDEEEWIELPEDSPFVKQIKKDIFKEQMDNIVYGI